VTTRGVKKTPLRCALFSAHTKYLSNQMKNEMGWSFCTHGRQEKSIWGLVRRPEGKRPLGRHRGKGKDNIEMGVKEVGLRGMDWTDMAQDGDR
jgi:hypothetical protein